MADVDDVGQCRRKPEPRGMDHARDAAAAADIKVAQAKVRRGVWQQKRLVAFEDEPRFEGCLATVSVNCCRRTGHSSGKASVQGNIAGVSRPCNSAGGNGGT